MSVRQLWTHEQLQAAADGDFARFAAIDRRGFMKGGLAAAAALSGVITMPMLPRSANAEIGGEIITFTWEGFDMIEPTKEWAAKNNVKVTNSSMSTQDDVQAKLIGGSPVRLDVTSYNQAYNTFYADELKILNPLDLSRIPNYNETDIFDAFYKKQRWFWSDTQWGVPFCWGLVSLIYNPDKMDKPTSYTDMLKPEMKGKFVISDDNTGTWPAFSKVAGVDTYPNVTKEDLSKIFENAKQYRDNARSFAASNGDIVSLMMSGDIIACLVCGTDSVASIKRQGGSAAYIIPTEGAFMWSDALCIPKSTGNIDTAHAFINEAMGAPAQAWQAQHTICGSPNSKAVELMDADTKGLFDYANLNELLKKIPLLGIPPRESSEFATYDEWVQAYEGLKSGI
jgi:spermidine/putrescine-binding protein